MVGLRGSQLAWDAWSPSLDLTLPRMPVIPDLRPWRSYHGMASGGCEWSLSVLGFRPWRPYQGTPNGSCEGSLLWYGFQGVWDRMVNILSVSRLVKWSQPQGGLVEHTLTILNSSLQATYPPGGSKWSAGTCLKPRLTSWIGGISRVDITQSWFRGITWSRFRGMEWRSMPIITNRMRHNFIQRTMDAT